MPAHSTTWSWLAIQQLSQEFAKRTISWSLLKLEHYIFNTEAADELFKSPMLNAPAESPAAHHPMIDQKRSPLNPPGHHSDLAQRTVLILVSDSY